jgi:hypothetical protein
MKPLTLCLAISFGLTIAVSGRADAPSPVVHVDAGSNVIVQHVELDGHATPICRAPCDRALEADREYQLTGEGLRASNRFLLPASDAATLQVQTRSSGGFVAGVILLTVSGVFTTGGLFLFGAMVALSDTAFGAVLPGIGAFFCGIGSLATGIPGAVLLANNIQSRAKVLEGDRLAAAHAPSTPLVQVLSF